MSHETKGDKRKKNKETERRNNKQEQEREGDPFLHVTLWMPGSPDGVIQLRLYARLSDLLELHWPTDNYIWML
jgi:hypothetical protein